MGAGLLLLTVAMALIWLAPLMVAATFQALHGTWPGGILAALTVAVALTLALYLGVLALSVVAIGAMANAAQADACTFYAARVREPGSFKRHRLEAFGSRPLLSLRFADSRGYAMKVK